MVLHLFTPHMCGEVSYLSGAVLGTRDVNGKNKVKTKPLPRGGHIPYGRESQ